MNNLENEWLNRAYNGDDEAFTNLVTSYQTPVFNLCYRMLGNPQEAEDAAQESFWRAYQNLRRYDPSRPFATWLLSIAAHYCIDQQRKRRLPTVEIDDWMEEVTPDHAPDPEWATSRSEENQILHRMLASLPAQDRAALILRYWYEFSEEEISKSLSMSVSAVKSRLFRARQKLALIYQSENIDPANQERIHDESPAF